MGHGHRPLIKRSSVDIRNLKSPLLRLNSVGADFAQTESDCGELVLLLILPFDHAFDNTRMDTS